jgi:hypothetical protein
VSVLQLKFEPGVFRILSRGVNHCAVTLRGAVRSHDAGYKALPFS